MQSKKVMKKYKFNINKYLIRMMKKYGKDFASTLWKVILEMRKNVLESWEDECNGKYMQDVDDSGWGTIVVRSLINVIPYSISKQWCIEENGD